MGVSEEVAYRLSDGVRLGLTLEPHLTYRGEQSRKTPAAGWSIFKISSVVEFEAINKKKFPTWVGLIDVVWARG